MSSKIVQGHIKVYQAKEKKFGFHITYGDYRTDLEVAKKSEF